MRFISGISRLPCKTCIFVRRLLLCGLQLLMMKKKEDNCEGC